ncbi:hypothetical protein HYU13_06775 [Candidatus Woesearchaeota archaeon]|nr:hypothetical protein [Candidatus Woesearchaeota archaeon]
MSARWRACIFALILAGTRASPVFAGEKEGSSGREELSESYDKMTDDAKDLQSKRKKIDAQKVRRLMNDLEDYIKRLWGIHQEDLNALQNAKHLGDKERIRDIEFQLNLLKGKIDLAISSQWIIKKMFQYESIEDILSVDLIANLVNYRNIARFSSIVNHLLDFRDNSKSR